MVISILMVIVGAVTITALPVAQFPNIVPPEVQVLATYVGADAKTIEQSVATPIEQQMSGVDNMNYMYSLNSTADGLMRLIVDYDVKTDPNTDLMLTQLRQTQAASQMPSDVTNYGVTVQKTATAPLMLVTVYSPKGTYDARFLANYAYINLSDQINRSYGIGSVQVFGAGQYAMRLWVKPDRLAKLGITVPEIVSAIQSQNSVNPAGQVGSEPTRWERSCHHRCVSAAWFQCRSGSKRNPEAHGGTERSSARGCGLRNFAGHDRGRQRRHEGDCSDAGHRNRSGAHRRLRVPARLARYADSAAGRPRLSCGHLHFLPAVRVLCQHAVAVWAGPCHRSRRRRCNRRCRSSGASHRGWTRSESGSAQGDGRDFRPGDRHRSGPLRRLCSYRFHPGNYRTPLPAICRDHRIFRHSFGVQCIEPEPRACRVAAASKDVIRWATQRIFRLV